MIRARCKNCNTIVESTHRHDWQSCACFRDGQDTHGFFLDGGGDPYVRMGGNSNDVEWINDDKT